MKIYIFIWLMFAVVISFSQERFIRTYGEKGSFNEGKGIVALKDTTYVLLGNRTANNGASAAWLFKVNKDGEVVWEKYFNNYSLSAGESLSKYNDTSVIVVGTALLENSYSIFISLVGQSGKVVWKNFIKSEIWTKAMCATADKSGNIYLTGHTISSKNSDILLYKINGSSGEVMLSKQIDDAHNDKGVYIDTLSGGFLALATHSFDSAQNALYSKVWKLNHSFDTIWTRRVGFNDSTTSLRMANCVFEDMYTRLVLSGECLPDTGKVYRFWYGVYNTEGNFVFEVNLPQYYMKNIRRGITDSRCQYFFTGGIFEYYFGAGKSDVGFWRDSIGYRYYKFYGGLNNDEGMDLDFALDSGLVFIGNTSSFGPGVTNIFFVKVDENYDCDIDNYAHYTYIDSFESEKAKLFPNPSEGNIQLQLPDTDLYELKIYNIQGQLSGTYIYQMGNVLSINNLKNGAYLLNAKSKNKSFNFKIILQK